MPQDRPRRRSPLPSRPPGAWEALRTEAAALARSQLWAALAGLIAARRDAATRRCASPNATLDEIRAAQGAVIAHSHDIMVIDELLRTIDREVAAERASLAKEAKCPTSSTKTPMLRPNRPTLT